MALKNFSVDEILDEIKLGNAKKENVPLTDMEHVDEIINEILTKRHDDELKRQNKTETLKEKKEVENEIKFQTKNLTEEFRKLSQSLQNDLTTTPSSPQVSKVRELKFTSVQKEQKLKYRSTDEFKVPKELKEKKIQKYDELKEISNNHHIAKDMKNLTNHFSKIDLDDVNQEKQDNKTDLTNENYQELKKNRNQKVETFVLEHKDEELKHELKSDISDTNEKPIINIHNIQNELEQDDKLKTSNEYEYNDNSQKEEVLTNLLATKKSIKISLIILIVLSALSATLFFSKISGESLLIIGSLSVTPSIYALINIGILLFAMVTSFSIFTNAIASIGEHKPDKDMLYTLTVIVCFLANVFVCIKPEKLLVSGVTLYTPMVVLVLLINYVTKYLSIKKIIKNFKYIASDKPKYALTQVDDRKNAYEMTKGIVEGEPLLVKNVKTDFFENFITNSFKADISDKVASKISIYSIPVAAVIGIIGYLVTRNVYVSISVASCAMLMITGFIGAMIVAFPLFDTAHIVNYFSGMMPEYSAIDTFKDTDAIMIDANELFPQNAVTLQGIKTFKGKRIDAAIVNAASVVCSANSVIKGVFLSIINNKKELLKPVDSIVYEDLMGISAWVANERVLIGNRELMVNHSVAVPKPEYEEKYRKQGNEVIFLASGGELCAAFIIKFSADRSASEVVNLMYKNDVIGVIKSVDSCITGELLERVFDIDGGLFKIIPSRLHKRFEIEKLPREKVDSVVGNNGSLFGNIVSIVACKKLAYCTKLGLVMYILSSVCGVLMLAGMIFMKHFALIGNLQVFIYMATFGLVYWIYEKNMKL